VGTTLVVAALGIANIVETPDRTPYWLIGILFLPVTMIVLHVLARGIGPFCLGAKTAGGLRAGLVGAGVALATAFAFAFTDAKGWTGEGGLLSENKIWLVLLPATAVMIDLMGARLEAHAEKDPSEKD